MENGWRRDQLEQAYSELKAGYIIQHGRIEALENEIENLREAVSRIQELRAKLDRLLSRLEVIKQPKKAIPYYG